MMGILFILLKALIYPLQLRRKFGVYFLHITFTAILKEICVPDMTVAVVTKITPEMGSIEAILHGIHSTLFIKG